jgi:hypothetical protein
MENNFLQEQEYIAAKKKVKEIKDFYIHLVVYVVINIFISCVIIFGLTRDEDNTFSEAISNFGVYATWLFWGIGLFFHWMGTFGFGSLLSKDWEDRKIKELMEKEKNHRKKM